MLIDGRQVSAGTTIRTQVCVLGAGPAGLTIADELSSSGLDVCVLEAGPAKEDRRTRRAFDGKNRDPFYYRLHRTRAWGFGGSSQRWLPEGVRLHPMQPIDFEARSGVPHSGWPFNRAVLEPFFRRAQDVCRAGPFDYCAEAWSDEGDSPALELPVELAETIVFQLAPGARFDTRLQEFERNKSVKVMLQSTALELVTDRTGNRVERVRAASAPGEEFSIEAKVFVLACGGIENARLLLLSDGSHTNGIGNAQGLVGRYFMEHPHMRTGVVKPFTPWLSSKLSLYGIRRLGDVGIEGTLRPAPDVVRREGLLNSSWWVFPREETLTTPAARALVDLRELHDLGRLTPGSLQRALVAGRHPVEAFRAIRRARHSNSDTVATAFLLTVTSEQAPNPDSRVTLGRKRDHFGRRKAVLDWRLTSQDLDSVSRTQVLLGRAFEQAGIGVLDRRFTEEQPTPSIGAGAHHMGTTRMHRSPRRGVVDEHCKVHSVENLYVAGSSVFPTGGYANPQLTLCALAIRLADHLKGRMCVRK